MTQTIPGVDEATRLAVLRGYEVLDTPHEEAFDALVALAAEICQAPLAAINLIDADRQWFKAEQGFGIREMPLDHTVCGLTFLSPGLTVVADLRADNRFVCNPLVTAEEGLRFYAGARLDAAGGVPLGTLCVLDRQPRPAGLTKAQRFALSSLAREVMDQLELRRALRERDFEVRHRRAVEQALRDSREQLDAIVSQSGIGIGQIDHDGRFLLVNDRLCAIAGRGRAELLGLRLRDITGPAVAARLAPSFRAMLAGGDPLRIETTLLLPEAGDVLVEATFSPTGGTGEERVVIAVVQDVTEQRHAERALRTSEARFRGAVEATRGVLWTNDPHGRMTGEQPGWSRLTGQSRAEYEGYGWAGAVHPVDAQPTIAAWEDAVSHRILFDFEHRLRCADGHWRLFSIRAVPALDEAGEVREWIGVHTDITEQRMTEAALQRLNERLEAEVEARTRERDRIWQVSRELIAVCDFDGLVLHANPAWTSVLGWPRAAVQARRLAELIHPDGHAAIGAALTRLAAAPCSVQIEQRVLAADDSVRWIAWSATSDAIAIYVVGRDVTAERERDDALRAAEEQLRQSQKMEAVGQLTGGIAHDFNNLLTAIVGSLELAQARLAAGRSSEIARLLGNAMTAATRAGMLTHRLLAFARRQALDPTRVELTELVGSMRALIAGTMGERIAVDVDLPATLWPVLCDANQLENALLNLAINARDAMPDGGQLTLRAANATVQAHADLGRLASGDYVAISVADTGCGISAALHERVFEPFFTTKPIGQGTGLGLSQLYGFVKQSNGHVQLDSIEGKGTRFTIWLPRAARDPSPAAGGPCRDACPAGPVAGTVLVVEDEDAVRSVIVEVLNGMGLHAIAAADGQAGLRALNEGGRIDLLVTDVGLPGLNGRQLAEMARTRFPELPVLFITGYTASNALTATDLTPGMQVLGKPFTLQALSERIGSILLAREPV